jgi:hypothetical protein
MGDYGFQGAGDFAGSDYETVTAATPLRRIDPRRPRKPMKGDRIKIVSPLFFDRCGYDNNLKSHEAAIYKDEWEKVVGFAESMGGLSERAFEKIVRAIAYERVGKQKFEGAERKVFTCEMKDSVGVQAVVTSVSYVKTGIYNNGHYRGTEDGDEYEPAYLSKEKTHRILTIYSRDLPAIEIDGWLTPQNKIEDVHCVLEG